MSVLSELLTNWGTAEKQGSNYRGLAEGINKSSVKVQRDYCWLEQQSLEGDDT